MSPTTVNQANICSSGTPISINNVQYSNNYSTQINVNNEDKEQQLLSQTNTTASQNLKNNACNYDSFEMKIHDSNETSTQNQIKASSPDSYNPHCTQLSIKSSQTIHNATKNDSIIFKKRAPQSKHRNFIDKILKFIIFNKMKVVNV